MPGMSTSRLYQRCFAEPEGLTLISREAHQVALDHKRRAQN